MIANEIIVSEVSYFVYHINFQVSILLIVLNISLREHVISLTFAIILFILNGELHLLFFC